MPLPMQDNTPITTLRPALQRVAEQLMENLSTREIATRNGMALTTIRQYVQELRMKLDLPPRCKAHVVVHRLLATGQIAAPTITRPVPNLDAQQQLLLHAVAVHSTPYEVALAAKIAPADHRAAVDALLHDTGTAHVMELVVLAHAWGLLGNPPTTTVKGRADQ
ncbi:DNA-binding protein [Streptomyces sp. SID4920]|nr:DNA-binding protein [Streptomyces sp. SID4920]MYX69272.1 DNA-binding protein [Streptomyces sp. SID8373]